MQAPAWAGVGLRLPPRTADPCWPADWWQRNYDTLAEEQEPPPCGLSERQMRVPAPP